MHDTVHDHLMEGSWVDRFPGLQQLPPEHRAILEKGSTVISVPEGTQVFGPGQSADNLLMLLEGTVRVQQTSDTGREVFLYRVNGGESCVLTTAFMITFDDYSAEGIAETDVLAVAIPRATFDELAGLSKPFRDVIFAAYSRRMTDLFTLIDDIVFQRMDVRLAARVLELAGDGDTVKATHQVLGNELGTAREVISRTLSEFQRRGWIEQSRGTLRIIGREGLERLARSSSSM